MYRITHFIAIGSPDAPDLPIQCEALPKPSEALLEILEAAWDTASVTHGHDVKLIGLVVPVVSDGPPDVKLAAAIAWLTFHGRMQPIEGFAFGQDTRLQPIVDRLMALKPEVPASETGGITLRL